MKPAKPTDPDVRLLAAAADPTRLEILRQLASGDGVCACDFTRLLRRLPADRLAPPQGAPGSWLGPLRAARDVGLLLPPARSRGAVPAAECRARDPRVGIPASLAAAPAGRPALVSHPAAVRVLFLCTHNSARSQMAEGFLRAFGGGRYEVASAGTEATHVRPEAITTMAELGIDISGQTSKTLESYRDDAWDLVVTVCDRAKEACPVFPGARRTAHWGFDDPAEVEGSRRAASGRVPARPRRDRGPDPSVPHGRGCSFRRSARVASGRGRPRDLRRTGRRRHGQPGLPRRGARRRRHDFDRAWRPAGRAGAGSDHRRDRARGLPGFIDVHSHAGSRSCASRTTTQDPPGRDHRADRDRRQLVAPVQVPRGARALPASTAASTTSPPAGRLAHHGRATATATTARRGQRLLHPGQLPGAHLGRRLGRPAGRRPPRWRTWRRGARGDGGGGLGPLHRAGLPARVVRLDRRAGRASRRRPAWAASTTPTRARRLAATAPGPVPGGPRHRAAQRHPGPPDPLPSERPGRRQPPGLHRPGGAGAGRGHGRHLRLLHLPLLAARRS